MTRPAPTSRSAACGALALTAAPWGGSAVVARGRLDAMSPVALVAGGAALGCLEPEPAPAGTKLAVATRGAPAAPERAA